MKEWGDDMEVQNIWRWIFIPLDAMGVWLLARPGDLMNFWTARRAPASDLDRFFARVLGVIILWTQFAAWAAQANGSYAEPILRFFLIALGLGAKSFSGMTSLDFSPRDPTDARKSKKRSGTA